MLFHLVSLLNDTHYSTLSEEDIESSLDTATGLTAFDVGDLAPDGDVVVVSISPTSDVSTVTFVISGIEDTALLRVTVTTNPGLETEAPTSAVRTHFIHVLCHIYVYSYSLNNLTYSNNIIHCHFSNKA